MKHPFLYSTTAVSEMVTKSSIPNITSIVAALMTAVVVSPTVQAAPVIFFDNMFTGATEFDTLIEDVEGTLSVDTWASLPFGGTSIDRGDYSFAKIDGSALFPTTYTLFNSSPLTDMSGQVIDISPSSTDPILSRSSGIEFTFDNPVNGFGLEVGDWATCCQPSALYISFDNGAPIQVGLSTIFGDQFLTNGGAGVFVGAIDDSGTFSKVQFWGDGLGEFLVAGGKIRYATVDEGSVSRVPEPGTIFGLLMVSSIGLASARKPKKKQLAEKNTLN